MKKYQQRRGQFYFFKVPYRCQNLDLFKKKLGMQKDDLKATNLAKEASLRLKSPISDPVLCTAVEEIP